MFKVSLVDMMLASAKMHLAKNMNFGCNKSTLHLTVTYIDAMNSLV